ncbi:MAG: hypothetical protein WDW38_003697 [Sanguina aurantia]
MNTMSVTHALAWALFVWFAWAVLQPVKRWRYRNIPGPFGWPLVGNLYGIITKSIPVLVQELEAKHGPVFKFWFGGNIWVVLSDPDVARRLSLRFTQRPGFDYLNVLPHKELEINKLGLAATSDMALWRVARKAYDSSLLIPASLAQYTPTMDRCVLRLAKRLQQFAASGETVDMWRELGGMTLEVVGECAYGIDFHSVVDGRECSEEQQKLGQQLIEACRIVFQQGAIMEASRYVPAQLLFPVLGPLVRRVAAAFPDARYLKATQSRKLIRDVSESILADWKRSHALETSNAGADSETTTGSSSPSSAEDHGGAPPIKVSAQLSVSDRSFLNSMMLGRDQPPPAAKDGFRGGEERVSAGKAAAARGAGEGREARGPLDDAEVVAQALTFILAGYETTANTLAFVIYLLAANPGAEARLLQEVDAFGRSKAITTSDLEKFPYVDAVVKESLRLHSPAGSIARLSTEEVQALGKTIPTGSILMFPTHSFQNSEQYWPRSTEFLPQRFLPEGQEKLGPSTVHATMPFGAGARMCPGYKFAQQEAKISLVRLYQNFTFRLAPGMPRTPKVKTGITTGPADGVPVVVHSRV